MVLEESISFSIPDQAREFIKLLKTLGVSAKMKEQYELTARMMYSGTYVHLSALIEELAGELTDDEEDSLDIADYNVLKERLRKDRDLVEECFKKYEIGMSVKSPVVDMIFDENNQDEESNPEASPEEMIQEINLLRLLHTNDMLDYSKEGVILAKKIEPDETIMRFDAEQIPGEPDQETLTKLGITRTILTYDEPEFVVTTGPDIIYLEDLNPIEEFFDNLEIQEDIDHSFVSRLYMKQTVITKIFDLIQKEGKSSRDEITDMFEDAEIPVGDGDSSIITHISSEYISAVLDDMKKLGVIKGKDQKLKVAA